MDDDEVTDAQRAATLQRLVLPRADAGVAWADVRDLVVRGAEAAGRTSWTVAAGATASTGTYFGAFPGAWWRDGAGLESVTCHLSVTGSATVRFVRSDAEGRTRLVAEHAVEDGALAVELELPDVDGGWLWCEVAAAGSGATVRDLRWSADAPPRRPATVTVCVTTFDREGDCIRLLESLARDDEVLAHVDRIVVADQGTRRLADAPGFAAVSDRLAGRLRVVVQDNLGGAGGFSRGMLAAVAAGSEFALLVDDDIALEPESVLRLVAFAARAERPTLVGAQMLSLVEPTVLHSFGERVDTRSWAWRPAVPDLAGADLREVTPESSPALHRRVDVDFNGWWMCLVPTSVVRDTGAALPMFIKWDDTEFALRARQAGAPTVTLPGAAVWHMPWTAKDDGLDWQAYFQLRNRLVTALLHGDTGTGVLVATLLQDANHVLCQQYGSAAVRRLALTDVLAGPAHLPATIGRRAADARALMRAAGQVVVPAAGTAASGSVAGRPRGAAASVVRLGRVVLHQLRRARPVAADEVVALRREDGKWWSVGLVDAARVASASGAGDFALRRDRRVAASLVGDAVRLRLRLWRRWRRLAGDYRRERDALAGEATWSRLMGAGLSDG